MHPSNPDQFDHPQTPTPSEIVALLDQHIVGQQAAKRAVAIAIRNRWRRLQAGELKHEISPKNILMIGPTGVGKTEIARRIASIVQAPFIKVEATKFTEVGYVGRDVDSIIRDLVSSGIKIVKEQALTLVQEQAAMNAEEIILDALMPKSDPKEDDDHDKHSEAKEVYRRKYRAGELDERTINIETRPGNIGFEIMAPAGMEDMSSQLQSLFQNMNFEKGRPQSMLIKDARQSLQQQEAQNLLNDEQIRQDAIRYVEENGIVFLDEIDKVVKNSGHGGEVSREGVQRDLLPLIEGTTVQTKYGSVKTDHILFIASGAFMGTKPSDMISELQGRLPIRVELNPLSTDDFTRILTEPTASLTKQYQALLATEKVQLSFQEDGIQTIAEIAFKVNEKSDNIGARRLHTIMEKLLEEISFEADNRRKKTISIDGNYVNKQLLSLAEDEDLSKWVL